MTIEQVKKRSDAIDMVKGLSIMTLFFLHFENGALNLEYNIFLVRSPAFYIVVGWLWGLSSNRRTVKQHWQKRLQGLIKPYIYFSLIFLLFDFVTILLELREPFILYRDLYKTLCLRGIGTLWFLPALLGGEILFLYLRTKKLYIKIISTLLILMLLFLVWKVFDLCTIYSDIINAPIKVVKDICLAYIFISIAYFISRRWGKQIVSNSKLKLFTIGTSLLMADYVFVNYAVTNETIGYILSGCLAGIGILLLFISIEIFTPISKPLVYCGRNSLSIMAIHYSILYETALIVDKYVLGYEQFYGNRTLIYFLIAVILQICINEFINKKAPFIIGK